MTPPFPFPFSGLSCGRPWALSALWLPVRLSVAPGPLGLSRAFPGPFFLLLGASLLAPAGSSALPCLLSPASALVGLFPAFLASLLLGSSSRLAVTNQPFLPRLSLALGSLHPVLSPKARLAAFLAKLAPSALVSSRSFALDSLTPPCGLASAHGLSRPAPSPKDSTASSRGDSLASSPSDLSPAISPALSPSSPSKAPRAFSIPLFLNLLPSRLLSKTEIKGVSLSRLVISSRTAHTCLAKGVVFFRRLGLSLAKLAFCRPSIAPVHLPRISDISDTQDLVAAQLLTTTTGWGTTFSQPSSLHPLNSRGLPGITSGCHSPASSWSSSSSSSPRAQLTEPFLGLQDSQAWLLKRILKLILAEFSPGQEMTLGENTSPTPPPRPPRHPGHRRHPRSLDVLRVLAWLQILLDLPGLATRLPRGEDSHQVHVTPAHRLRYNSGVDSGHFGFYPKIGNSYTV